MKKGASCKTLGLVLCLLTVGFIESVGFVGAVSEKTTISITDSSPWFTKECNSGGSCPYWWPHIYNGHDYISTYVGGMISDPSQPDYRAIFKPYLSYPGKYNVYAYFYACKDTSTKVPFTIKYDGGSTTIQVNQYSSSPTWKEKYLGAWDFQAGSDTYVKVTDATGEVYDGIKGLTIGAIKFVKVNKLPTCSLTANPRSGNAPLTVTFSMSASDPDGSIAGWVLDVDGDGNADYFSTGYPPSTKTHTYTSSGSYTIMLVVSDNDGDTDYGVETINVGSPNQPPSCSLTANPRSGNAPLTVTFSMSASDPDGSITTWLLNAGDGNSYSGSGNPPPTKSHTYTSQGSYNPVLGVGDNDDAMGFGGETISVGPPTQLPGVSTSEASGTGLTSATLNGNLYSTGGETCQVWFEYGLSTSYGDSTVKQSTSSTGAFSKPVSGLGSGTDYHFRACASNSKGTVCGPDKSFTTLEPVNQPPSSPANLVQLKYDFVTEMPVGYVTNERTVFLRADAGDPDGDKVKLQIELRHVGDNFLERLTQQSSLVTSNQVSVAAYGLPNGNYHWQARAMDEHGLASEWVSFGGNSELAADFSVRVNYLPVARFVYSPEYPGLGEEISFDASNSYDPDGGALSYSWDFGDGGAGSGEWTSHTYSETGHYTVTLTVTDDEGSVNRYSSDVGVFSTELGNIIKDLVDNTNSLLEDIYGCALDATNAADFFADAVEDDVKESIVSLIFEVAELITSTDYMKVKHVSALSIADESTLSQFSEELAKLVNDGGWVIVEGMEQTLWEGMETVAENIAKRLGTNDFDYFNTFKDDLVTKKDDEQESLNELKNEVLGSINSLSQEEINLYKQDLQNRSNVNKALTYIYCDKAVLPSRLQEIKEAENADWKMILGKISFKIGLGAGLLALGTLGLPTIATLAISGAGKLPEIIQNAQRLNTDGEMVVISSGALFDGFTMMDYISRNTFQALENINENNIPSAPKGKIIYADNFVKGVFPWSKAKVFYGNPPFLAKEVYTKVEIINNGNVKTTYELVVLIPSRPFSFTPLVNHDIPFILGTERKELEPGQIAEIIVWYKKGYFEGFKPKDQCIKLLLFGEGGGIYKLDEKDTCFGTIRIVTNDVNVSEEELEEAPIYYYPIASEMENSSENYTLDIYIENPFESPIQANLTQEIPLNLVIISAGNGTINSSNISWQLELEPEERKSINITLEPGEGLQTIEIPGAMLKIYDQVNDRWIEFLSNNVSLSLGLTGDIDGNCIVNIFDLAAVGLCYGQSAIGDCQSSDLTGDGIINIFDLATVGLNYGKSC